jgi:ADP-ribose pyrophosphatase YjhB (NUDIX family)
VDSWVFAQFRDGEAVFLVRVGGVAVEGDRVLLHRTEHEDFWSLPGGRLEVGETAAEALVREMREEIDADIEVGGLLWVIENFFTHAGLDVPGSDAVRRHHEVGLYLSMYLPADLVVRERFTGVELAGTPHEFRMEFRWFDRSELGAVDVRPAALRERLAAPLPTPIAGVVQRG